MADLEIRNASDTEDRILRAAKVVAVVGLSVDPKRPSHAVAKYLQQHGYRIVPVNPSLPEGVTEVLGERAYATLDEACEALTAQATPIDCVDVFRAPAFVPEIVKDVIRLKIPSLWLQEGVCHEEAAEWAAAAGVRVVMDRCMMKQHRLLAV